MIQGPTKVAICAITVALALAGCATTPPKIGGDPALKVINTAQLPVPPTATIAAGERPYIVNADDRLVIDVRGVDALDKREVRVDSMGWISLPLVGSIEVGGKPIGAVETMIADKLLANYLLDPRVTINVSEPAEQRFAVEGQVRIPGLYPVKGRMTLLQAIAQAQGTDEFSKLNDVVIFRTVDGQRYAGLYDLKAIRHGAYPDPEIFVHDIITVGDSRARRLFKDVLQIVPLATAPLIAAVRP